MSYQNVKEIGQGGFGIVYEVTDSKGGQFARKILNQDAVDNNPQADLEARFHREVKYQSAIEHPNVVRIVDSGLDAKPLWFVMELAECSLANELEADRTLGGDPKRVLFDILTGLQAIHAKGYKHRDLKPQNILRLRYSDGSPRYAISDFGLMSPDAGQTTTLTATNAGGGTPLYCAPECTTNLRRATHLADIYSFGAILHDIFSGLRNRLPYDELSVEGPLKEVVEKCTKRQPRRRYQSVDELREALFEALDEQVVEFQSPEEQSIVELLSSESALTPIDWDRVFDFIDDNVYHKRSNGAILRALTIEHIHQLAQDSPELFDSLGRDYAEYAGIGEFDFDYCDVLASRASAFYQFADNGLKALLAIAMLKLGTGHNRWYVERVFLRMASPSIDPVLAERIRVEIGVQGVVFQDEFEHLERSISASITDLHPLLQALLASDNNGT